MDATRLEELLASMARAGATSLHFCAGQSPQLRVQRRFVKSGHDPIAAAEIVELTDDLLFADLRQALQRNGQVDVLYVARSGRRFRATVAQSGDGRSLVMRPVPDTPPRLIDLELPEQIGSFTQFRSGMVVVTGFFGSGKSTTLAALVDQLNQESHRHIVTIEDPIEFLHPPGQALLHQREVGLHVGSFADGLRQARLLGADVLVASDLDEVHALDAALTAAENGCLVFASVDASSVVGALSALLGMAAPEARPRLRTRLAGVLRAVTAQLLLPRQHQPGRVPASEILIANAAVRQVIRQGTFGELPAIMQRCRGLGMQTIDIALRGLLARHQISPEDAQQHTIEREQHAARGRTTSGAR